MKYLFCTKTDEPNSAPAEEVFLKEKAPRSLTDRVEKSEYEILATYLKKIGVPQTLEILQYFLGSIGVFLCILIESHHDTSLAQTFQSKPYLYLIAGCCFLLTVVFFPIRKKLENKATEDLRAEVKRIEDAEKSIRQYLCIPNSAKTINYLSISYRDSDIQQIIPGTALCQEMTIFANDGKICLFDGQNIYSFSNTELDGIRLVNQEIFILSWDWIKTAPPSDRYYQKCGVIARGDELKGFRFFCALDISRSGETYTLLFPAYELQTIRKLTGLSVPELPPVAITKESNGVTRTPISSGKLSPLFYWKASKEDIKYFNSSMAEEAFKELHPIMYYVLGLLEIGLLLLPPTIFYVLAFNVCGLERNGWEMLGIAGGALFGSGLCNIVAAFSHRYLGHILTIILFTLGTLMMIASWILVVFN